MAARLCSFYLTVLLHHALKISPSTKKGGYSYFHRRFVSSGEEDSPTVPVDISLFDYERDEYFSTC